MLHCVNAKSRGGKMVDVPPLDLAVVGNARFQGCARRSRATMIIQMNAEHPNTRIAWGIAGGHARQTVGRASSGPCVDGPCVDDPCVDADVDRRTPERVWRDSVSIGG
jgi:hypothetical protein